jgi:hypothetical protein
MYATYAEYLGGIYKRPKSTLLIENFTPPLPEQKQKSSVDTSNPKVWGPSYWTNLHISAIYYPENPSPIVRERIKNRILAIPHEIPCDKCRCHANSFIEANRHNLDKIVANKHSLGKFYVDFHNQVNKRYGKSEWTYDQAYKYYSGKN